MLTQKEQKALDYVKRRGRAKGISIANHIGVSEPAFRSRYVKKLRQFGLRNNQDGEGYYIAET